MNSDTNWPDVKEIFAEAIELPRDEQMRFVSEVCGADTDLRAEVESWLESYVEASEFIETPLFSIDRIADRASTVPGQQFGKYQIIREIGRGGMGAVFLAERVDGEFEQQVALKIVRQSIAERHMVDRFRRERQILASLNHPNIAKLLDGGISENDEPFLVMEYVEGLSIVDFVEQNGSTLPEKLSLFIKVCDAVAYAHRNLVVHRDIKPGNILVNGDGEPMLLDFGLARLVDDGLSNSSENTQTEFRALTPAYASPEQLKGDQITTATDIYSLGVILYELLTGVRPFRSTGKNVAAIVRSRTDEPLQLPSRVSGIASLRGDLDNIVLTALRSEPLRRYPSVEKFSDDINRYLRGMPVAARPNTYAYRFAKFFSRNRIGVTAAAMIVISLIAGLAGTTWQARQAELQRRRAESINTFLEQTLKYSNPVLSPLRKNVQDTTIVEVIDEAARRIESGEFDNDPELKLELEYTIAMTFFGQGKYDRAREHMANYVALVRSNFGEGDPKFIVGSVMSAMLLFSKGDLPEAEEVYRSYMPALRRQYERGNVAPEMVAQALDDFAYLRRTQGDSHEAEMLFRESLDIISTLSTENRNSFATTRSTLASTIADQGRFDDALATADEAVEEFRSRGETGSASYAFALTILGGLLTEKGDLDRAESTLSEGNGILTKLLGPNNLWTADNFRNIAMLCLAQGKYSTADTVAVNVAKTYEDDFGKHYDQYPTTLVIRGLSLSRMGSVKQGEALLREAVRLRTASLPPEHYWVADANGALGECLTSEKRYLEAETLLKTSYESLVRSQEPDSPRLALARTRLINLYTITGRPELADPLRSV